MISMTSQRCIRRLVKAIAPNTPITKDVVTFIATETEQHIKQLIQEAVLVQKITNLRRESCKLRPNKRLNLRHFCDGEERLLKRGKDV